MGYRLTGTLANAAAVFPLREGRSLVGSSPECDLRLSHPTVSRRHAELQVADGALEVTDLRSSNGTFVDSRRIDRGSLQPGQSVSFGAVALKLELVPDDDLLAGVTFALPPTPPAPAPAGTVGAAALQAFTLDHLPGLVRRVLEGGDAVALAQAGGAALFEGLPCLGVEVTAADGVLFQAHRSDEEAAAGSSQASAGDEHARVAVRFAHANAAHAFQPLVQTVADLVRLAAVREPPRSPAPLAALPPLPEPASVVPEMRRLFAQAGRLARGDVGVLICGESGTGKELLARFIHSASQRARGPFVALNCAALPRDLLETELFGIERGVATGVDARPGKFELAHGGTLFLDEVGDMALETQARILRVLQEGEVFRIGGSAPRRAAVRTVAATNRDVSRLLAEGRFREDLYYRIATWVAEVPPLRRRREDIPNLAASFLMREAAARGLRLRGISRAALAALVAYDWPGNVRQLEKEMSRAALFLGDGDLLDSARLLPEIQKGSVQAAPRSLPAILAAAERAEIERALGAVEGDVERAAAALGLSRSTLYRRIKRLGLTGLSS